MSLTIELPEKTEEILRERAKKAGVSVGDMAVRFLNSFADHPLESDNLMDLIDWEYHSAIEEECRNDSEPEATLEEVRAILSKIPGNWSDDILADREERY